MKELKREGSEKDFKMPCGAQGNFLAKIMAKMRKRMPHSQQSIQRNGKSVILWKQLYICESNRCLLMQHGGNLQTYKKCIEVDYLVFFLSNFS